MAKHMRRARWLLTAATLGLVVADVSVQSPAATLAPTGTLRAVFLGGNPVQGRVDPKTGEATGTVADLVKGGWHGLVTKNDGTGTSNVGLCVRSSLTIASASIMPRILVAGSTPSYLSRWIRSRKSLW